MREMKMWKALAVAVVAFAVIAWVVGFLVGLAIKTALLIAFVAAVLIGGSMLLARTRRLLSGPRRDEAEPVDRLRHFH
jgi:uncharacterized membrane protein YfcA